MQHRQLRLPLELDGLPRVLVLGNGLLRLREGLDWSKLLEAVRTYSVNEDVLKRLPFAMQPEALCGVEVEEVQRKAAAALETKAVHPLLQRLLALPFDAVITTNYTYEVEETLTGKAWNERQRAKTRHFLHGSSHVRHNTCLCDLVETKNHRQVVVFHPHGDQMRKHSVVLSYYSYASTVHHLIELNKERGNSYQERQQEHEDLEVWSWMDYFLMGDVYAVGFGFDLSEFDIWWAIERKAREKAEHGRLHAWMIQAEGQECVQQPLFDSMDVDARIVPLAGQNYATAYEQIIESLEQEFRIMQQQSEEK